MRHIYKRFFLKIEELRNYVGEKTWHKTEAEVLETMLVLARLVQ
jgi:hypothetical protein